MFTEMRLKRLVWLSVLVFAMPWGVAMAQTVLPMIRLRTGTHRITAEVAATLHARDRGLMNRRALPAGRGMLFVFPEVHRYCMWMHDTSIPLSVAFIDDDGTIVNIADMKPHTEDYHCAARPVRYALEMNAGWFRRESVDAGSHISGLEKAPPGK